MIYSIFLSQYVRSLIKIVIIYCNRFKFRSSGVSNLVYLLKLIIPLSLCFASIQDMTPF